MSESIGKCPFCGGPVVENDRAFGCANWRDQDGGCRFHIWKTRCQRPISPEEAKTLLEEKKVGPLEGFVSRAGRPFSATLKLEDDGNVSFEFPPRNS